MKPDIPHIPLQAQELLNFNTQSVLCLSAFFFAGLLLVLILEKTARPKRKWLLRVLFLVAYSTLCAVTVYRIGHRQEQERRTEWARRIAGNRDMEAEARFEQETRHIAQDTSFSRLARSPFEPACRDSLQQYFKEHYIDKAFPSYQCFFTLCQKEEMLLLGAGDTLGCNEFFELKAREGEPSSCSGLSVIDYGIEYYAYLYRLPVACGDDTLQMNVEMGRKKFSDVPGSSGLHLPASYSYAFYSGNDLWSHNGDFLYPFHLHYENPEEPEFWQWNGYSHLSYPLPENRMLVISTPQADPWEILHNFSLFFLLFGIAGSVILLLSDRNFTGSAGTYQQRLRASTYFLLLCTFSIFAVLSLVFLRQTYRNENAKILRSQCLAVLAEMESHYLETPFSDLSQEGKSDSILHRMQADLEHLADLFRCEIFFYSVKGQLLSGRENLYIPDSLDSGFLNEIEQDRSHLSMLRLSTAGDLHVLMAIAPFRNAYNEILGYLCIPYFSQQDEWRNEMNHLMGAYLNVMVVLSILMLLVSYLLARRITGPLSLIARKVSQISLTRKNEHLVWKRNDEIGSLVKQYNLLLDELETSSRKLAESERESAWNEMARQIAHEIKNPLTPMKLQVQQLQRAYRDGKPDFAERLNLFSDMLSGQIDRLAAIASTFSQFAKWQKPVLQEISPAKFLENICQFYKACEQTEFVLDIPAPTVQARIKADPKFLEQIFHNLIRNALQALSEQNGKNGEGGKIRLGLKAGAAKETDTSRNTGEPGNSEKPAFWILSVADNGPGIEPGKAQRIFEPHFTTRSTGAGLGLSICRKLAESMNARILLEENRTQGACFLLVFPAA